MKLSSCLFNPPNGTIRWDKLKFLYISQGKLVGDSIGKILSGSPCLETLDLYCCYGVGRIDATSKRFKNLVLNYYGDKYTRGIEADYIDTIEINAPNMLSLTIKGNLSLEKLLLLNVTSLAKVDLDYQVNYKFAEVLGRDRYDIQEELLRGLLQSLRHVNEITLGYECFEALSCLRAKGFQVFRGTDDDISRVGVDGDEDIITELIASEWKEVADICLSTQLLL
ncbi:ribonuclease H-like domain-containing protein [Tanacetum coccineum]